MSSEFCHRWLAPMAGCTVSYLVLLVLTFEVLGPGLEAVFGTYQNYGSLVFLPHAVRILAAWLFGWRAVPLLLPALAGEHLLLYGAADLTLGHVLVSVASVTCAPAAFDLLAMAGLDLRRGTGRKVKWPDLVLVASAAAVIDSVATAVVFGNDLQTTSAWFLGDVIGMVIVFLSLRGFFSLRRRSQKV